MTHLTPNKDALAKALLTEELHRSPLAAQRTAARLIASGAVIDASTLVDDEALREVVTREVIAGRRDYADKAAQRILRALAAALTERSQR